MNKYWKNKSVLITGHEGFLGSWLCKGLIERGARVVGIDKVNKRPVSVLNNIRNNFTPIKGNIANLKLIETVINKYKPQVIFHLAAEAIVEECYKDPVRTFKSNIQGTWNILETARDKKFIESIVIASSDKAYGSHKRLPYHEDIALKGDHPYDVSKSCADLICYTYFNTYNVPVCVTRCGNIFGPGDFHFSRIVPDTIRCALSNKPILIRSDGNFTRDYIYVEDIVNGYILLAQNIKELRLSGEAFNFSCDKPIPVIELVKKIYKLANSSPNYRILNKAKYEIRHQYLSSKKARRILRWKSEVTLDEGLKKTIKWYRDYFNDK